MTEAEKAECLSLGKQIAEVEAKLAAWRKQKTALDGVVSALEAKLEKLNERQKSLIGIPK